MFLEDGSVFCSVVGEIRELETLETGNGKPQAIRSWHRPLLVAVLRLPSPTTVQQSPLWSMTTGLSQRQPPGRRTLETDPGALHDLRTRAGSQDFARLARPPAFLTRLAHQDSQPTKCEISR